MAENKRDYYEVLGVDKKATTDEIKRAYRKMAMKYHPDRNPGDKDAEERFKEINEAYGVLSNEEKRSRYDQFGFQGVDPNFNPNAGYGGFGDFGGFADMGGFGDIFGSFFGGGAARQNPNEPRRGQSIAMAMEITFEEAAFGAEKELTVPRIEQCTACNGTGSADGVVDTCATCRGTGQVRSVRNMMGMAVQSMSPCPQCGGKGKIIRTPCTTCRGKGKVKRNAHIKVTIPAGIDDGESFRCRGQGNGGDNGGPAGDLLVEVSIKRHPIFRRDEYDVLCEVPITFSQAALGAQVEVPTLDGTRTYTIPEGTQTGTEFVMPDLGVKIPGRSNRRGNHRFTVVVETPTKLTREQRELLEKLDGSLEKNNSPKRKKFSDMVRDFFDG